METRHVTYLQVKAVERADARWIEGWATTPAEDRMGDVVLPEGAVYRLPLPLLFAHKHDEPIGSVAEAFVTKAGIRIRAKLTAGVARAEEVWRLLNDGALTAVSIGFGVLKSSPLPNGGLRFDKWDWHELSVVSVPANSEARISVGKSLCYAIEPTSDATHLVPTKMAGTFAKTSQRLEPVIKGLGIALRGQFGPIKTRLVALEKASVSKALDAEAYDVMNSLVDRLGRIETALADMAESGIRYRGYWEGGKKAERGDAFTHNGSLWWAVRNTAETPSNTSPHWMVAVRKGKDAK